MASKELTRVNDNLRERRDFFVELVWGRNTANVESQPLYVLEAGGGKGVVLFSEIDAETAEIRMRVVTDKVFYKGFVDSRNCPFG